MAEKLTTQKTLTTKQQLLKAKTGFREGKMIRGSQIALLEAEKEPYQKKIDEIDGKIKTLELEEYNELVALYCLAFKDTPNLHPEMLFAIAQGQASWAKPRGVNSPELKAVVLAAATLSLEVQLRIVREENILSKDPRLNARSILGKLELYAERFKAAGKNQTSNKDEGGATNPGGY